VRTRLDEIVEEEFEKVGRVLVFSTGEICKRVAELAFRHGVERGIIEGRKFDRGSRVEGFDHVQPAPAEENVPVRCPTCGGLPHPYPPSLDRRKGERRVIRDSVIGRVLGAFPEMERRSGKDRRKP
jgi:hypothetical protein